MQITCPGCAASYRLGEKMRGRKMFCPHRGQPLIITGAGTAKRGEAGPPPPVPGPPARNWTSLLLLLAALLLLVTGGSAAVYFGYFHGERQERPALAQDGKVRPLPGAEQPRLPGQPVAANQDPGAVGRPATGGPTKPTTGPAPVTPTPPAGPSAQPDPASSGAKFVLPLDALGKPERLAEVKGVQLEGKVPQANQQVAVPFTLTWDPAGRWRYAGSVTGIIDGEFLFDGKQDWYRFKLADTPLAKVYAAHYPSSGPVFDGSWHLLSNTLYRNQVFWMGVGELSTLAGKGIQPSVVGDATVKGHPAVCVRADWVRDWRDAKLYFDRDTHLLVKAEWRGDMQTPWAGSAAGDALWEVYFSDYRETDGIKHWSKIEFLRDGGPEGTLEITSVRYLDKVDDALFQRS